MSRVGLRSICCAPHTAEYRDTGCRRTISVCSSPSGNMAQGLTSSGKRARDHHINHPIQPPQSPPYPKKSNITDHHLKSMLTVQKDTIKTGKGGHVTTAPPFRKINQKDLYKLVKLFYVKKINIHQNIHYSFSGF